MLLAVLECGDPFVGRRTTACDVAALLIASDSYRDQQTVVHVIM